MAIKPEKLAVAVDIAFNLIDAGSEIYRILKASEDLSDDDILSLIQKENAKQDEARAALEALLLA